MAKIDELKEELGILKFWLGVVVMTFLALVGWFATNYQKAELIIFVGALACMFLALVIIYILDRKIKAKIKEIGRV